MDPRSTVIKNTILLGALLTILGTGTFAMIRFAPGKWTALIPAFFGVMFLLLGVVAQKQNAWHRPLILIAVGLALVAFLGASGGLVKTAALLAGEDVERPAAALEQAISAVLCAGFLATFLKSLIAERRTKVGEGA